MLVTIALSSRMVRPTNAPRARGFQRGLLLPQAAVEWGWDRQRFLEGTCVKAGLPRDAWKQGATLQAFTAQVFSEPETPHNRVPIAHGA